MLFRKNVGLQLLLLFSAVLSRSPEAGEEMSLESLGTEDTDARIQKRRFVDEMFEGRRFVDRRTFRDKVLQSITGRSTEMLNELHAKGLTAESSFELSVEKAFIEFMQSLPQMQFDREFVLNFLVGEVFEKKFGKEVSDLTREHRKGYENDHYARHTYNMALRSVASLSAEL